MRTVGLFLLVVGVLWAMVAFNMDTTVTTDPETYGSGEYAIHTPSVTVNNIGLMETRRNHLMFSGLAVLAGIVLMGFAAVSTQSTGANLKTCPYCAERIQAAALKCRYCGSDVSVDSAAQPGNVPATLKKTTKTLQEHVSLIEQGKAEFSSYSEVIQSVGGDITAKGFIFDMHYLITLNGKQNRVDKFADLQQWFSAHVLALVANGMSA